MTIKKALPLLGAVLAIGVALWLVFPLVSGDKIVAPLEQEEQRVWECNGDAKICPDGSAVGRTGPNCEFMACPAPEAASAELTTYLGGSPTALNVSVHPREIVSDSRCPEGVQCIWAGTVEVRTVLSTQVSHGEHVMKLGEPRIFGDYTVTLIAVTPGPKAGEEIPESSYRFTFEIKKR